MGVLLALIALLGAGVGYPLVAKYQYYQEAQRSTAQRLARYERIIASKPALQKRLTALKQRQGKRNYYLSRQQVALAETDLRQLLERVVSKSGGRLKSTQSLEPKQEGGATRVSIQTTMVGDTEVLRKVFYALESHKPLLLIHDIRIRSRRIMRRIKRGGRRIRYRDIRLTTRFQLSAYMRGSPA